MRYFFIAALLLAFSSVAISQKSPVKFGDISMEDMKMTSYNKDSSAAAVVLLDYGESHVESRNMDQLTRTSLLLTYERHVRIKILKSRALSALNWYTNPSILLLHLGGIQEEKVSGLKASTYNLENGKIVETPMNKESVFKEKVNKIFNRLKFTLPNVKEGSIVEYTYVKTSGEITNFPNWQFQRDIPVRYSEYWAIIPDFLIHQKYLQGYITTASYEVSDKLAYQQECQVHHWISKDVPAFKVEPFMTSEADYVSMVNFAISSINIPGRLSIDIMGSWDKLNQTLSDDEDFGKVIFKSAFLKDKANELTAGITDPMQKITAIHTYVKQNIEWDGTEDFYAYDLKKTMEQKKGSSGDINLMLAALLNSAGLEVDMLLLSTRDHGFIRKQFPMVRQFNYVICVVRLNDKNLLLDATEKYLPLSVLPQRCLNGEGLIVSKRNYGWMDVASNIKTRTSINADLMLDPNGELKGKVMFTRDGYDAFEMRKDYFAKGEESYVKKVLGGRSWNLEKTEFSNVKELDKSAKEVYTLTINEHASIAGDIIYISPFIDAQLKENPFKSEKREYPVDFGYPIIKAYSCKLTVPDGYTVDELPKSQIMKLADNEARFVYNSVMSGNLISITSSMQINKSIFVMDEYPALREFFNQVIAKQAEQIVLKKKQ